MSLHGPEAEARSELDRQVERLLGAGYPKLADLDEGSFLQQLDRLGERLSELPADGGEPRIPFVIVVAGVPKGEAMRLVELDGKRGFTRMEADDLERFTAIDGVELPPDPVYLLAGIDTGGATLNVPPDEAITTILAQNRSPLTIDEGIALVTHYPDVLRTQNCFSMLGSRDGDRRVTAMWISGGSPRLGWCWAGAPHTWLGSASCATRVEVEARTSS